ncbi:ABC transporter substrate-binding protein [Halococcus sp. IIIV-5B]|uniref:ABC transporter substrate-binding protein n=1 Tax=Halococcus sp. IIIV-5B TaxID=2321230 RepID=UPI000E7187E4|nr:ABC transporter substrate-binding protein [Halococcus sp. IIIV-5B]RJT06758.1 Fe3+-hydroxamate ABC transporter substrate-binding protein [Halococcus sp. IIIV-5B]
MRRRRFLATTAVAGGLLAGCTGSDGGTNESTAGAGDGTGTAASDGTTGAGAATESGSTAAEGTGSEATDETGTASGGSYSVTMPPVGTVSFDSVPETWVANNGSWADMGVALGKQPPKAVWLTERYHTQYYDEIPGVSVDKSGMQSLYSDGVSKELFYELDGDVHVIDPNFLLNRYKGWNQTDIKEIETEIAPFFGNSIFSRGYDWHEDYPYLSLYEAFEKLSQVFQETERYEAFAGLHDDFQSNVSEVVPSGEKPAVAIMWAGSDQPDTFSPYLISPGTSFKQWRDLEVRDAFADTSVRDFHADRSEVDFETLLEVDPDVLLLRGHEDKTRKQFQNTVVSYLESNDTASALTAVENGDVYRGGPLYQGPITNLVLTERAARQVYGASDQLFDRQRVADIVTGSS